MQNSHAKTENSLFPESIFIVIFLEISNLLWSIVYDIIIFDDASVLIVDHLIVNDFEHSIGHNVDALGVQG